MANHRRNEVRIDVASLTSKLQNRVSSENSITSSPQSCCIFKVPKILYRHNPIAYEPNAFSIGPFHSAKPHLKHSEHIKLNYLKSLLSRRNSKTVTLRDLILAVTEIQGPARDCYAEPIGMSRDEFVETLVIDGCFLVELFRRNAYKDLREQHDPIFSSLFQIQLLNHDLILLENQIPWIVLDLLYNMTQPESLNNALSLAKLAVFFLRDQSCFSPIMEPNPTNGNKHILDLLRSSMVTSFTSSQNGHSSEGWEISMPSVSSLKEAGIKFEIEVNSNLNSILDLSFDNRRGVLKIPKLFIHEHTEPLFRNLISYEQCLPNCEGIVTSYAILLDNLINTKEDMEILIKYGVISNWLNIEDSTKFFNQLYDDTFVKHLYYTDLIKNVNKYCRHRWPKYRTVLMHDYFKHPWSLFSVIGAIILLTLTFLQTIFTITKG